MNIKLNRKLKENITGFLLLLPSLIFMMSFTVLPVFKSFYLSFTKYNLGMKAPRWIGFENYMSLFKSELFWKVMFNTIFFSVITVVPSMILGLTLAFLVNRKINYLTLCEHGRNDSQFQLPSLLKHFSFQSQKFWYQKPVHLTEEKRD